MALDIGELVGKLRIDEKGMDKGLEKGESKFKKFGDKLTKLALGLGLAAGAAIVGGILGAVSQEALGAKIAAQMGGSAEQAKQYGKTAGKLYAEGWGDSLETIGDTLSKVAGAGITEGDAPEELEDLTRRAQILADVFGQDVDGSVRAVQQLIRNGLVPDAKSGFDLIAVGIQGGLDKSGDLLDTINEYSTEFRELGINGYQAFGLLQQAVKGGARDTDTAADALKEFAIRSKDASATSIDGFKSLGLNAKKMTADFAAGGDRAALGLDVVLTKLREIKDPVEQNRIAVELFGTKAEDLGNALFSMDLETAAAGFDDTAGAIDKAGKAMQQTDAQKLEAFKRQVEQTATKLGADLIPYLKQSAEWIKQNESWVKPLAETLGTLAAAIVVVNLATKAWAATEAAFATIKGVSTAAQWLWNASLYGFPVVWIIAAVIALIAIIVLAYQHSETFRAIVQGAWAGIKIAAEAVWNWLKNTLWPFLVMFFKTTVQAAIQLKDGVVTAFNAVWGWLKSFAKGVGDIFTSIGNFIAAGWNFGVSAARGAVNSIIGFVNKAIGGINSLISIANKVPGVNIGNIGTIPKLATGGVVGPTPGGTPVIMGDGGQVEYGVPDDAFRRYVSAAVAAGGGSGHGEMRIELALVEDGVIRIVRRQVRRAGSLKTLQETP